MKKDTQHFLEAVLFTSDSPDESTRPLQNKTIYDFHPDFVRAVDFFIEKFEEYLEKRNVPFSLRDDLSRSFGANIYYSLSGHGVGFWDDSHESGQVLNDHLVAFSGSKYRFEQIQLSSHRKGKLDLAFLVAHIDKQRHKLFFEGLAN